METIQHLVPLVFTGSLVLLVLAVGLDADVDDLLYLVRRPGELIRAVLAVNIIVPVAGILLVALLPISMTSKAAIALMAVSPVPPLIPGNEMKVGARKEYAYGLYAGLIVLAIVVVPLTVSLVNIIFGVHLAVGVHDVARNVALAVILPLAVGVGVRHFWPGLAARTAAILGKIAMVLLVIAMVPMLVAYWPTMAELVGDGTVLAIVAMVVVALAAGHALGGPLLADRAALAVAAATRHPGIALMIASGSVADKRVPAAIIMVMLVGLIAAAPYKAWVKRQDRTTSPPHAQS